MYSFLKQATASQSRALGPFIDDTDFKTAKTALTIANTDIKLSVNGGASANKNSGGGTHRVNGVYGVTFDATDTATVGELFVSVVISTALPVFATFIVVEEAIYDQLFGASALGYIANAPVNVAQINASSGAATKLERGARGTFTGTVGTGSTTTNIVFSSLSPASAVNDQVKGKVLTFDDATTTAALRGQSQGITAYVHSSLSATVAAFTTAAVSGDTFTIS
jgi:hypothetical protein